MGLFNEIVHSTKTQDEIYAEKMKNEEMHLNACIKERVDYYVI